MTAQKPAPLKSSPRTPTAHASTEASHAARAIQYAEDVHSQKILACVEVRQAAKRFLNDLRKSKKKSYRWTYGETPANRFCKFFEGFRHYKNDFKGNASAGRNFRLEPWQLFGVCNIFGWVDKKTGLRRFTEVYWEVPKKNGKTPMAAGIGLFCFAADREFGAEVFAGAATMKASTDGLFLAVKQMAESSAAFREAFGVWVNSGSLVIQSNNSTFKPLKAKPQDGPSAHCVIADEYHEYKTDRLIEWARGCMTARSQPLLVEITTAGTDTTTPCYAKHLEVQEVLEGRRTNERLWCVIYTVDKGIVFTSKKAILMANPNYGVSVNPEQIEHDQEQAKQSTIRQNEFKTKNLNIWVNQKVSWMNMVKWDACADKKLRIEDFNLETCIEGVDLASRRDTVSTARMFKRVIEEKDHYYCFMRHYLNEQEIRDPRHTHYQAWADAGHLIETPGDITSYLKVNDDLAADSGSLVLRELVFDPFHAAPLIQFLRERGDWNNAVTIIDLKQNEEQQSIPMKEFEAVIYDGRFHFDGNPVMSWMIGNTACKKSERENWRPIRKHVDQKIDGTIAILLAFARWLAAPEDNSPGCFVA
jgi:phage terminase large subunit-like protein